jgi:DNA polymerase III epsilon subunit-like protein
VNPRTVYFDLETAGLKPAHPDIQLAAVAVDDVTGEELAAFEAKLQFDVALADIVALEINHWTAEAWKDADLPRVVVCRFELFLKEHATSRLVSARTGAPYWVAKLAGHNAATFDGPRLKALFDRHSTFLPADLRTRDTAQRALWWFDESGEAPPLNFRLVTLCHHFGVPVTESHEALADVRMTVALAKVLRTQYPWGAL